MAVHLPDAEEIRSIVREELRLALAELRKASVPDAMSTEQAAMLAGVTPKTVRTWVETGALSAHRRGRRLVIRRADLEAHLAGSPQRGAAILSSLTSRPR